MSAEETPKNPPPSGPESQSQRWAKYGSNVALTVILAIVVAGLITYIAQAGDRRIDTTAQGVNSLKPQTRNVLRDLNTDIKIVSLYTKAKAAPGTETATRVVDKAAFVSDLLDNYKKASSHITTEAFDPVTDAGQQDQLLAQLDERYGQEIKKYQDYLAQYGEAYKQLTGLVTSEAEKVPNLSANSLGNHPNARGIQSILDWVQTDLPRALQENYAAVERRSKQHRPQYKEIVDMVKTGLENVSQNEGKILDALDQLKNDPQLPPPIRQYFTECAPRHQQIKKLADDQLAKISKLADLKVEQLKRDLGQVPNPILVLGPNDWKILSESQVWPENTNLKMYAEGKVSPTFAGEQQITGAIIALTTAKKPKIAFLRPGGPPMTSPGFPPFIRSGDLSEWGARLREYDFDVVEKDLSGQWAMQAQMQQMPSAPEPDWSAIEDAVWVILDSGGPTTNTPEPLGPKLAEHLGHGGSAIVLVDPQADNLSNSLKDWGVEIRSDVIAVHEQVPAPPGNSTRIDPIEETLRQPLAWDIKRYGDADLAQPLQNLESFIAPSVVINSHPAKGYSVKSLLPLPTAPQAPISWGETNISGLQSGDPPTYDSKTDLSPPLAAGAAVEKQGGGRLVVIGCARFAFNIYFLYPDQEIRRTQGLLVPRFPGNAELAMNSAFWCAKMDSMIALSPSALQVSRIADMSPVTLNFWRVGVLLVLLPLGVLACGMGVYFSRRD